VVGLSIGSEDLYRISPIGIAAPDAAPGADPATLLSYIKNVKSTIAGTSLSGVKIGHVDTWTAWVNSSNSEVVAALDWVGMDAYPYFQNTMPNSIELGPELFDEAYANTTAFAQGKDVWVTETGWPVSGKLSGNAVASIDNAKTYWDEVGCSKLFGKINTFWFTLQDSFPTTPNPSFGIVGSTLSSTPLYDLSCKNVKSSSTSSTAAPSKTATKPSESSKAASSSKAAASSAASTAATSGGLTPAETGGNGVVTSATKSATASVPLGTGIVTSVQPGGVISNATVSTAVPSTTGPVLLPSSGASVVSGSFLGAVGALAVAVIAL